MSVSERRSTVPAPWFLQQAGFFPKIRFIACCHLDLSIGYQANRFMRSICCFFHHTIRRFGNYLQFHVDIQSAYFYRNHSINVAMVKITKSITIEIEKDGHKITISPN